MNKFDIVEGSRVAKLTNHLLDRYLKQQRQFKDEEHIIQIFHTLLNDTHGRYNAFHLDQVMKSATELFRSIK
jgi:hypothetical protein